MELRDALEHLAMLGTEQTVADDIEAGIALREVLDGFEKKEELAIRPADQANALDLLGKMQDVVGGIVYEVARQEVLHQIKNVASDVKAARRLAEKASKSYGATRKTWDGLHVRLTLVEDEAGVHTRDKDAKVLWKQVEALSGVVAGRDGLLGILNEHGKRLEQLKDLEVYHRKLADQVRGSGKRLGLITRVSRLAASLKGAGAAIKELVRRVDNIERDGLPMAGELEQKLEALAGKLEAEDRAHRQLSQTVRGHGDTLGHSTRIVQLELDVRNLRQKLKDLGEHPALV